MKQPKIHVTDINGNTDWGLKPVKAIHWGSDNEISSVSVDFMENGNSNDYSPFYNYSHLLIEEGELINAHGNLKGVLIFE